MRRSSSFSTIASSLFFFVFSGALAQGLGCSSGDADPAAAPANPSQSTDPNQTGGDTPAAETPIRSHPVCATIETGPKFGQGCSGSGSGDVLCEVNDPQCGTDRCVYDSRNPGTFAFYCSAKCTVGGDSRCPAGYECVAPSESCASTGTTGLCAQRAGFGCDPKVKVEASGRFFEGPKGELYHLESTSGSGSTQKTTLKVKQGSTFKIVATFDGDPSIRSLVRSGDSVLLVTGSAEVLIKDGQATAQKRDAASLSNSYGMTYGVTKDGAIVSLSLSGSSEGFAALSRRGDDGAWTEVGPTRQRVSKIAALGAGFLAICQKTLCGSADGETFAPIANLPAGVSFEEETRNGTKTQATFAAVGASVEDFYLTTQGKLFHQRKGTWVEEGPKAKPPVATDGGSNSGYQRPDVLRAFSDGTVVFHTYVDRSNGYGAYATYVGGEDCFTYTVSGNLDNTDLVKLEKGNVFVYSDSYDKQLCTIASR